MTKILFLILTISILFTGCFTTTVIKPVYKHNKTPILEIYELPQYKFGKLYNKDNKVCVKKWDTCIDKKEFITLIDYMKNVKSINNKYHKQITIYNTWSTKNNK